jgi:hypothetical protein
MGERTETNLGNGLGLVSLLGSVLSKTSGLELFGSFVDLLVIRAEEVDILIIITSGGSGCG